MIGIDNLKAGIHSAVGIICDGIKLAKKSSVMVQEAKDLQFDEVVAIVTQIAVEEAPRVVSAIRE